jgi:hypothetical protein
VTVLVEIFLSDLDVHLCPMFLKAEIGVFFEPPRRDLTLTNATEYRIGRRILRGIGFVRRSLSESCQVIRQYFSTDAQRLHQQRREINSHFPGLVERS